MVDKFGYNALIWAAFYSQDKNISKLIAAGVDPHYQCKDGTTALIKACSQGHAPRSVSQLFFSLLYCCTSTCP